MKKFIVVVFILVITACGKNNIIQEPTPTITSTFIVSPTNTPTPTATPTPLGGSAWIAYVSGSKLYLIHGDGTRNSEIFSQENSILYSPRWSPNGKNLAFIVENLSTQDLEKNNFLNFDLYIFHLDENIVQKAFSYKFPLVVKEQEYEPQFFDYNFFFWSPDSKKIAYINYLDNKPDSSFARELFLEINYYDLDSGEFVNVSETTLAWDEDGFLYHPLAWSPDSSMIAFSDYAKNNHGLFLYDLKTTSINQLTESRFCHSISWTPDGDNIIFIEDPSDGSTQIPHPGDSVYSSPKIPLVESPGYVKEVNVKDSTMTKLSDGNAKEPVVSPDGKSVSFITIDNEVIAKSLINNEEKLIGYACVYYNAQFGLTWSPDSQILSFRSADAYEKGGCTFGPDNYGISAYTIYGGKILFVENYLRNARFSPDSNYLAILPNSVGGIQIGNLRDGQVKEIETDGMPSDLDWQP